MDAIFPKLCSGSVQLFVQKVHVKTSTEGRQPSMKLYLMSSELLSDMSFLTVFECIAFNLMHILLQYNTIWDMKENTHVLLINDRIY